MNRPHKFNARRTEVNGISFASAKEGRRYAELKLLERAGQIRNLELQPRFDLIVNGKKVCRYIADFAFFEGNERIVLDVKGYETREFKLKRKLFEALFPGQRLVIE